MNIYLSRWRVLPMILFVSQICLGQYVESDWAERDNWMNIHQILQWAGVGPGDTVADIGCHEGYLSMHLAKKVGKDGRVFAVDVRDDRINNLRGHAADRGLNNITTILGDFDNPRLPRATIDVAFLLDTYHEIEEYMTVLEHIRKALKPGGRIVVMEKLKDHARGKNRDEQAAAHTLSSRYVIKELKEAGFLLTSEYEDLGDWENEKDKTIWLVIGKVPQA